MAHSVVVVLEKNRHLWQTQAWTVTVSKPYLLELVYNTTRTICLSQNICGTVHKSLCPRECKGGGVSEEWEVECVKLGEEEWSVVLLYHNTILHSWQGKTVLHNVLEDSGKAHWLYRCHHDRRCAPTFSYNNDVETRLDGGVGTCFVFVLVAYFNCRWNHVREF